MAAIGHTYAEQLTQQTTTSTTYGNVSGAVLSNTNLVAGKKYLILCHAIVGYNGTAIRAGVKIIHGSTDFASSEQITEQPSSTPSSCQYSWWTVWTAVSTEDVKMQLKVDSASGTVSVDQVTMFAMNLSDDLVENTDWFFSENSTSTTLSSTYSTTNNASITLTPGTAGHDWLVLARSRMDVVSATVSYKTMIDRSGEATSTQPELIREPDITNEITVMSLASAFNLGAASNTFQEKSAVSTTGTTEARTHSGVLALNLNKFREHSVAYTEAEIDLSATQFATLIQTISITPSVASDVFIIAHAAMDAVAGSVNYKRRVQLDNTSDLPSTQTIDLADNNDARDEVPLQVFVMENLSAAAHTIDFDGSTTTAAAGRAAEDRSLIAFTMELPASTVTIDMWGQPNQAPIPPSPNVVSY